MTRLTGLSPHTIRVWERRYGAVQPSRTPGNSRRYSAEDVRRLILLRRATQSGYKIKDIAVLPESELGQLVADTSHAASPAEPERKTAYDQVRRDYLDAVAQFEVRNASEILGKAAMVFDPEVFVFEIILPILRETGDRWHEGVFSVAHEHLVTFQTRGFLDASLRLASPHAGATRILVATPEGYEHEFGALVGALLASSRGFEPIYLGPGLPEDDLVSALELSRAELLLLSVAHENNRERLRPLRESLARLARRFEVWVGLPGDHSLKDTVPGVRFFERFEDLDLALTQRGSLQASG